MRYRRRTDLREDTLQMSGTVSHSSRRAHLLTTSSEQTPYPSLRPGRGRAHSFRCSSSPHKGRLPLRGPQAVVFPLEIVRSPRGLRLLRQPMDNATLEAKVLSLSTQLVCGTYRTEYRR